MGETRELWGCGGWGLVGGKGQCEVGKGILCASKGMGFAPFVTGIDMILCPMFEL